jgi:hypothetical protein
VSGLLKCQLLLIRWENTQTFHASNLKPELWRRSRQLFRKFFEQFQFLIRVTLLNMFSARRAKFLSFKSLFQISLETMKFFPRTTGFISRRSSLCDISVFRSRLSIALICEFDELFSNTYLMTVCVMILLQLFLVPLKCYFTDYEFFTLFLHNLSQPFMALCFNTCSLNSDEICVRYELQHIRMCARETLSEVALPVSAKELKSLPAERSTL